MRSVMVPGGLIVTQQRLEGFSLETGPDDIARGRYFFYRA
ncbi:class I SAM-dependent methyltransferase [Sulfitobacter sp. HI0040]|nr:class I SAM-dependent methyltransferase [Sulfitobacter sp. HI0040]